MIYSISGLKFPAVEIKIKEDTSLESRETYSISFKNHDVANCGFIASNQNIYHDNGQGLIFSKNHGYTYDFEKEKEENLWEIMRITEDTEVLDGPALNYDVVTNLKVGDLIVKTKESVNDHNRTSWDKIKLPNGTEVYIDSTKITEHSDDYTNLEFENSGKKYNVYFSPSVKGMDLEDYPYYLIKNDDYNEKDVCIYFSKTRMKVR